MIKPEGKNVAYLLGAGASCQALPIVGEMPAAFRSQAQWILSIYPEAQGQSWFNHYREKMTTYASAAEKYGTIDTYARSLYLLKKYEEFAALKLHLAMYFLLEQAVESRKYSVGYTEQIDYSKPDQIDKRYMTWLAQVLDNDGLITPRIHILSWNYDLQIEHAIGLYHGLSNLSEIHSNNRFTVYPDSTKSDGVCEVEPALIHLNGIAGHAVVDGKSRALYGALLLGEPKVYIRRLFEEYDGYDKQDQWMLKAMQHTFNFAWEDNSIAKKGVELAMKCLRAADILVIIGYSFPAFNRSIDIELMCVFAPNGIDNKNKRIHIQSRSITTEGFGHLFNLEETIVGLKADPYLDQFYLPPELFN